MDHRIPTNEEGGSSLMAKIRGVKPEFWTDERVVEVSRDARLLFIGMWNFACDNGHLDDKPKQLKMKIFPGDDDTNLDAWLDELVAAGRIVRDGTTITIPKFAEHQKPHKRWWTTCDLPLCTVPEDAPPQGRTSGTTVAHGGATAEVDCEVDCEGDGDTPSAAAATVERNKRFDEFWKLYPRKEGKTAAAKAWKNATKLTKATEIIDGLRQQLPSLQMQRRTDGDFRPHPATWLNQGRWADEIEQPPLEATGTEYRPRYGAFKEPTDDI